MVTSSMNPRCQWAAQVPEKNHFDIGAGPPAKSESRSPGPGAPGPASEFESESGCTASTAGPGGSRKACHVAARPGGGQAAGPGAVPAGT